MPNTITQRNAASNPPKANKFNQIIISGGLSAARISNADKISVMTDEIRLIRFSFFAASGLLARYKSFTKIEDD